LQEDGSGLRAQRGVILIADQPREFGRRCTPLISAHFSWVGGNRPDRVAFRMSSSLPETPMRA
jgi:hypothetical protein